MRGHHLCLRYVHIRLSCEMINVHGRSPSNERLTESRLAVIKSRRFRVLSPEILIVGSQPTNRLIVLRTRCAAGTVVLQLGVVLNSEKTSIAQTETDDDLQSPRRIRANELNGSTGRS